MNRTFATLVTVLGASALTLAISGTAHAQSSLAENQELLPNQQLTSPNGEYFLRLQGDGNIVFAQPGANYALWASGTNGFNPLRLLVQGDGNVVFADTSNVARWTSGTNGWLGVTLSAGNDAQVHIDGVEAYWATGPAKLSLPSNTPPTGHATTLTQQSVLHEGDYLQSQSGEFIATVKSGNLIVTQNGRQIWQANTGSSPATHLAIMTQEVAIPNQGYMMVCGDLELLDDKGTVWFTAGVNACRLNTGHTDWEVGGSVLTMQNDGNLVLYASMSKNWPSVVVH